ncbi:MAG: hypothetical protein ACK5Q5_02660, partial [Planctomycetaceae bacterium]
MPLVVLAIGCAATAAFAWQATAHQQTVAALELAIQKAPRSETLITAISRLLPLLENDEPRSMSDEERQVRALGHCKRFGEELDIVRKLVRDQQKRCQDLVSPRRRRAGLEDTMTAAVFGRLEHDFDTLEERHLLADITPVAADSSEAPRTAPLGPLTRRSMTLTAFRQTVFGMIDGIRTTDLASRLMDQFYEAQLRVVTAWRCALVFAIVGTLAALAVFYIFERSFWRPLQSMRGVVEGIANRRYEDVIKPKGAPEIAQMFSSLSAIRERGRCSEDDREKEVEDRS